jgi:hypothetical protein
MMERHSFWPIAQRVKERRSLKKDSVIKSNVTEGIPSLPTLEFMVTANHAESKVTACRAMRGTRSSGDDIGERDAILEVAVDNDDNYFSTNKCHSAADTNKSYVTEGVPPLPPFELKGFQHLYKSTKTMSS